VQVTHALLILQGQCTHHKVVRAMRELLEGWAATEEERTEVGSYQHRLLNAIDVTLTEIKQRSKHDHVQ
jgi:hypothetical protein